VTNDRTSFRMGIIGAGIFAEANHYPSLSHHALHGVVARVAICDLDRERAETMAGRYGWGAVYTDASEMLTSESLDGVIVCAGGPAHPDLACAVLEAGLPVFLEKPAAIDLAGTQRIAGCAARAGLPVQVGHQKRHGLAHRRVRDLVADAASFGRIVHIDSKQLGFPVFPTFYTCMLEWQCHNLDFVMAVGGDVTEVEAKSFLVDERHGALNALLRFESGAVATLTWGTYGGPGPFSERVEIVGDRNRGVAIANAREVTVFEESVGEVWTSDWNPISQNQSHVFNGYVPQLLHFVEHVRSGQEPEPSIHDEVRTMQVLTDIAARAEIPLEWAFISSAP
jgi:predicted dehydrogenase